MCVPIKTVTLKERLIKVFPFIGDDVKCDCGGGWYSLIHSMLDEITEAFVAQGKKPFVREVKIWQQAGILNFSCYAPADIDIHSIASKYSLLSHTKCELCGRKGRFYQERQYVRCAKCHNEAERKHQNDS